MVAVLHGPREKRGTRDKDGHRNYEIDLLVQTYPTDGPAVAMNCPGIFVPGAYWNVGTDVDLWAYCLAEMSVKVFDPGKGGENERYWIVTQKFTTRPPDADQQRCHDDPIGDPLLEPVRVSGSFLKYTEEATVDRFGVYIKTSSHEMIRGQQNEWDANRPTLRFEQNSATLDLPFLCSLVDTVNVFPIWGLLPRCCKCSNISWEKVYYGSCSVYYKRSFEFDINFNTFDRDFMDEGTKALRGKWSDSSNNWELIPVYASGGVDIMPNPDDPAHFDRYMDRNGNYTRVILDGEGKPYSPDAPTEVTDCAACPGGTYLNWIVRFLEATPITLTQDTGIGTCVWTNTSGETSDLRHITGDLWEFTYTGHPSTVWELPSGVTWKCKGPNRMIKRDNVGTGPSSVLIDTPVSKPGSRHTERYNESDFLLTGLPTTF